MFSWLLGSSSSSSCSDQATTQVRDREACWKDYEHLRTTSQYPTDSTSRGNSWFSPSAETIAQEYLTVPHHDLALLRHVGHLCVVTGVHVNSTAALVAQELALTAAMHVVLVGKGRHNASNCRAAIMAEAVVRGLPPPCLYTAPALRLDALSSVRDVAQYIVQVAQSDKYNGRLQLLVHLAHVGSSTAKLTNDGLEYNTGCNFIAAHYLTQLLLPILRGKSNDNPCYPASMPPRIIYASSMGHCLGTNFDPQRLQQFPAEGGAPAGFLQESPLVPAADTALLTADTSIALQQQQQQQSVQQYTTEQLQKAVQRQGTQVGRSKMALLGATYHLARVHAQVTFFHIHLLPISSSSPSSSLSFWPVLRAALDTAFDKNNTTNCYYLHSNGNPWTPMEPAQDTQFGQACFEAANAVLETIIGTTGSGGGTTMTTPLGTANRQAEYQPPTL